MIVLVEQEAGWLQLAFLLAQLCCASGAADSRSVTKMSSVILVKEYSIQDVLLSDEHGFCELFSLPSLPL